MFSMINACCFKTTIRHFLVAGIHEGVQFDLNYGKGVIASFNSAKPIWSWLRFALSCYVIIH